MAFGVLCAFVYSMTLLPAAFDRAVPVGLALAVALVDREFRRFLLCVALLAAALVMGIPRIELTDNWTRYFDERYEFRHDMDFVIENLTGIRWNTR